MSIAIRTVTCLTVTILLVNVIWSGMGINSDPDNRIVDDDSFHTSRFYFMDVTTTVLWSWILVALPITRIVLVKGRSIDGRGGLGNPPPQTNPDNDPSSRDPRRRFHALSSPSETSLHQEHTRKSSTRNSNGQSSQNLVCGPYANSSSPFYHASSSSSSSPTSGLSLFWTLAGHSLLILVPALGIAGLYTWWLVEFLTGHLSEHQLDSHLTKSPHQPGHECEHLNGTTYYDVCRAEIGMAFFALASVAWVILDVIILCSREWRVRVKLARQQRLHYLQGGASGAAEAFELSRVRSVEPQHHQP